MAKNTTITADSSQRRHQRPLEQDLIATGPLRSTPKKRKARRGDDEDEHYVDSKSSRKILKIGRDLQDEEDQALSKSKASDEAFTFKSRPTQTVDRPEDEDQPEEVWEDEEGDGIEDVRITVRFEISS